MKEADQITVQFRGVRGSIPASAPENMRYGGNTSCVEIRYADQLLILDAGSGIRVLGDDLLQSAQGNPIEATVLLSHSHWDHIQGLPFFAPGYSPDNRITIFGECGRGEQLQGALEAQMAPEHFPVRLQHMRALQPVRELSRETTQLGSLRIRTTRLNHPGGCTGFRIESAAGHVAYLPDHEPYRIDAGQSDRCAESAQNDLIEFLRGVDLLILDTQYTAKEYAKRIGWGHGCLPNSVDLAIEAGARRLLLFHHDPSHNDRQLDDMVEVARPMASGSSLVIDAASEHEIISLTSSNIGVMPMIGFSPFQSTVAPMPPLMRPEKVY